MKWFYKWRLTQLNEDLAAINAEIAADLETARKTRIWYPIAHAMNAETKARLEFRINAIESALARWPSKPSS